MVKAIEKNMKKKLKDQGILKRVCDRIRKGVGG
jgi:hypothetical protein